ncbi:MAG: hypothetical protein RUMPE_00486 [Eubacteriales bacterium SKADARSKE-1]|nr:hypothetical protein [Eubacteriales bacterium SKADARSKE-1]
MKKVLSSILVGSMLISSMGAISIFADGTETSVSATEKASSEASSTETELGEAIGKLKENIKKLEVKSFWERNKGTILKVTGGALAAAATGAALYLGYNYLWANGTPLVNPAGDQIGNPTEDPAVKSVQSQDPTATAAGTSANPAVDPAANSDQTPTPQVEGIQSKEAPVNTDVCLQEEENICLPVDKDIINTADVSADPSANSQQIPNSHDADLSISTNQNLFANSTKNLNVSAAAPSASPAEAPIGKQAESPTEGQTGEQAVVTPEAQMSCEDLYEEEYKTACEIHDRAQAQNDIINQNPLTQKQLEEAKERCDIAQDKFFGCKIKSTGSKVATSLKDAVSKAWGGISSTASNGWNAMWDFDDAAAKYTYVGPVKAAAWTLGGLITIFGGKRAGLTPTKFVNALRRGGGAALVPVITELVEFEAEAVSTAIPTPFLGEAAQFYTLDLAS